MNKRRTNGEGDLDSHFFKSLSIDDSYITAQDSVDDGNDEDYMDIDDEIEYSTPEPNAAQAQQDDIGNGETTSSLENEILNEMGSDDTCDYEESSLSIILSPTTLGAKLAMHKPKLITSGVQDEHEKSFHNSLIDYEYDLEKYKTSNNLSSKIDTSNVSYSYSSESDLNSFINREYDDDDTNDEFVYNSRTNQYDENIRRNLDSYHQSFNQQYQNHNQNQNQNNLRHLFNRNLYSPYSVQIHHHHYYNDLKQNQSTSQHIDNFENRDVNLNHSKAHRTNQSRDKSKSEDLIIKKPAKSFESNNASMKNQISQSKFNQTNNTSNHDILPLPWESRAHPISSYYYFLSSILQLITNFVIFSYIGYQIFLVIRSIKQDINHKLLIQSQNLQLEIEYATKQYYENDCFPDLIVPALQQQCNNWEKIMNLDPNRLGNISLISAETIGMIMNGLIEPLGIKFILIVFGLIVVIYVCNFSFGYIRAKNYYGWDKKKELEESYDKKRKYW